MSNHTSFTDTLSIDDESFKAQSSLEKTNASLMQLKQLSVLDIVGADAIDFLQNMLSNDVQHLQPQDVRCACLCSPKGRVIATLDYWLQPIVSDNNQPTLPRVRLLLAADIRDTVHAVLKRFVLRRKVELIIPSEQLIISFIGAPEQLFPQIVQSVETIPSEQKTGLVDINLTSIPLLFSKKNSSNEEPSDKLKIISNQMIRFKDVIVDNVRMARMLTLIEPHINSHFHFEQRISQNLPQTPILSSSHLKLTDEKYWDKLAIYAGQVRISKATSDQFIPQMINFEIIGGVDFKKGCYPGQEVVARSQYRGAVKRRTQRAYTSYAEVNHDVFAFDQDKEQAEVCGRILMTAPASDGGIDCLIEINKSYISSKYQFYVYEPKHTLVLKDLPYSIT